VIIEYGAEQFKVIFGSDIQRDGFFAELYSSSDSSRCMAELFYSDQNKTMTFSCSANVEMPLSVLQDFCQLAKIRLTPNEAVAE